MKKRCRISILWLLIIMVSICFFLTGCTSKPRQLENVLGSPAHHAYNGFKLIKKGRLNDAQREFEQALQLDPEYSPAYRGIGLAYGMKERFNPAFESMRLAMYHAKEREEKALAYVGFIRLQTMKRDKDWLDKAENNFSMTKSIVKDLPDAYYYMGIAYKYGYRFDEAEKAFKKVLEIDKAFIMEAEEQLKIVYKIERATPESKLGKRVAVMDRITRADVAALFIQELRLDRIYKKTGPEKVDLPPDVENHTQSRDIKTVLQLDIKGLGSFFDGNFGPDEYITRGSYAVMIADIIATIEDDPSLATRYAGSRSPFDDVRNDMPIFNAVMVCTKRGIIVEAGEEIFDPIGKVSGADALLVIKKLKEKLL